MKTVARFLLVILAVTLTAGNAIAEKKKKGAKAKQPAAVETPAAKTAHEVGEEGGLSGAQEVAGGEDTEPEIKLRRIPLEMEFTEDGVVESDEPNRAAGLDIFLKKCSACHSVTERKSKDKRNKKKEIAPSLLNVTARHSEEWLIRWLTDPQVVWEDEEDEETNELKQRVLERGVSRSQTKMKLRLKQKDVLHMIAYLNTVIDKEKAPKKKAKKKGSKKSKKKKK
jgi:mono/diheme cytochrome c family protein